MSHFARGRWSRCWRWWVATATAKSAWLLEKEGVKGYQTSHVWQKYKYGGQDAWKFLPRVVDGQYTSVASTAHLIPSLTSCHAEVVPATIFPRQRFTTLLQGFRRQNTLSEPPTHLTHLPISLLTLSRFPPCVAAAQMPCGRHAATTRRVDAPT